MLLDGSVLAVWESCSKQISLKCSHLKFLRWLIYMAGRRRLESWLIWFLQLNKNWNNILIIWQLAFPKVSDLRESNEEVTVTCITQCQKCHLTFIRSWSLSPTHIFIGSHDYRGSEIPLSAFFKLENQESWCCNSAQVPWSSGNQNC